LEGEGNEVNLDDRAIFFSVAKGGDPPSLFHADLVDHFEILTQRAEIALCYPD
jgi:hypothetical protein